MIVIGAKNEDEGEEDGDLSPGATVNAAAWHEWWIRLEEELSVYAPQLGEWLAAGQQACFWYGRGIVNTGQA